MISDQINSNCTGILWITDDKVTINHPNVYELNYLLDGLLVKTLTHNNDCESHFFLSENFGAPFFVGQIVDSDKTLKKINEQLDIIVPIVNENKEVYILNQSKKHQNLVKDLHKKYPQLTFKNIQ